jgi:cation:H+ antiporter
MDAVVFVAGAAISLATSWGLVSRIERIGSRLRASEALLGLMAAFAADSPEISAAVSALARHQQAVGVGVVLGSNVFNLAALLGLGAVVAGRISLHRRVVVLEGAIALWISAVAGTTIAGALGPVAGMVLVLSVLVPYGLFAALHGRIRFGTRMGRWLESAMAEEEIELRAAVHPRRGRSVDFIVAGVALVVVVVASVAMERAAVTLGSRWSVAQILVGAVVLAAVTSLPNAVAAVYLARRGRGVASLSTALNSNAINVAAGLLLPAAVIGLGPAGTDGLLVAAWYGGSTALVLVLAYAGRGLRAASGALIVLSYAAFLVALVLTS